jgi:hypothetical protein
MSLLGKIEGTLAHCDLTLIKVGPRLNVLKYVHTSVVCAHVNHLHLHAEFFHLHLHSLSCKRKLIILYLHLHAFVLNF